MASASAKQVDLVAEVGATFLHRFLVTDEAGTPIDWTAPASTAKMQIRTEPAGDIVVELAQSAGITLTAAGEIDLRIEATEIWTADATTLARVARYVHDLLVKQGGDTFRIADGVVEVRPGVTTPPP